MKIVKQLWHDDAGFVVSTELILVATILVIGLIVGLSTVRNSVVNELSDVAAAFDNVSQGVGVKGVRGHGSAVAGWKFIDQLDFCNATTDGGSGNVAACIVHQAPTSEGTDLTYDPSGG